MKVAKITIGLLALTLGTSYIIGCSQITDDTAVVQNSETEENSRSIFAGRHGDGTFGNSHDLSPSEHHHNHHNQSGIRDGKR